MFRIHKIVRLFTKFDNVRLVYIAYSIWTHVSRFSELEGGHHSNPLRRQFRVDPGLSAGKVKYGTIH